MGGNARRGVLFEGPPGTGKTYLAKAMAAEAGVPFLFVSASEFQSMYYGQTNKKIRSFFKALRKAARDEGGAIGYIEEFDAIGGARSGMNTGSQREGIVGVVNELLVQMQSFDLPTGRQKFKANFIDWFNGFLPDEKRRPRPKRTEANILIVASTNRAADLDPALLRPGRFDRVIGFNLPPRRSRGDRRVLPGQEESRGSGDGGADRRSVRRLHARQDREAARRGVDHRAALQPHVDERDRRPAGSVGHRGRRRGTRWATTPTSAVASLSTRQAMR